jgi:hypothetical protein
MGKEELKRALPRVPSIADERYEKVWKAIAERTFSENQKNRIKVSALVDGELAGTEREQAEKFLAGDAELTKATVIWKKLAAATAALPVPKISEAAARKTGMLIKERTKQARRTEQTVNGEAAPSISSERWSKVWDGIQARVQQKGVEPAKVVPISSAPMAKKTAVSRWRWVLVATAAAALVAFAVLLQSGTPGHETGAVAVAKTPEALDERYESSVEYVDGQKVVCFYLKPQTDSDSPWLPD